METKFYRQCILEKHENNSLLQQVSYIPEKFAIVGKVLRLRELDGPWTNGWVVQSAGELRSAETVEHDSRLYLKTRLATDVMRGKRNETQNHHR